MSLSSFSDVRTKSTIKSAESIVSSDCDQQQQQQPMDTTHYDGSSMHYGTIDSIAPKGNSQRVRSPMAGRRASYHASELKHGRRSAIARKRQQKVYKSNSFPILANPYLNFLRDYRLHFGDRFQGQELVQRAAHKWKSMTNKERSLYEPQAYQRGKFTALVENVGMTKMKTSGAKLNEYTNDTQVDACRTGVVCPPRSPPKRSCRPKANACKKRKPACHAPRRKHACKPKKPACKRPKKSCKPRKRAACRPKKRACKPRKPACRPKKPKCKPKKAACKT